MFKDIFKLFIGNGLAQSIQMLGILFLSKIYTDLEFGILAQIQAFAMLGSIIASLQLHLTLPIKSIAPDPKENLNTIQTLILIFLGIFIIPSLFFSKLFTFSVILSAVLALANSYTSYIVAKGNFSLLSKFYIVRASLIVLLQILFGYLKINNRLVLATLIAETIASLGLYCLTHSKKWPVALNFKQVKPLIIKQSAFTLYGTIQELVSVGAFYAPLLLFSHFYSQNIGGQYAMASRLVWAPVILITRSFSQVLYNKYGSNSTTQTNQIFSGDLKTYILIALALTFLTICSFFLKDLYILALGRNWVLASELIPLQLLWGLFFIISTPFRVLIRIFKLQKIQCILDFFYIFLMWLSFYFINISPLNSMYILVLLTLIYTLLLSTVTLLETRKNDKNLSHI